MTQDIILMTSKELSRYETITKLIDRQINGSAAAKQLILTVRHIRRLKSKVKQFGAKGLIHRNRGKSSNRRIDQKIIAKAKIFLKSLFTINFSLFTINSSLTTTLILNQPLPVRN